jgi:UDP-glucose 4-epimerase
VTVAVTGAAGFVGSHLCEALVADGIRVVGIDCFTDYYARARKEDNLAGLRSEPRFTLQEADLATSDLEPVMAEADVVYHLAGQPGVRASWGEGFAAYVRNNVTATQRVLEAARSRSRRVVFASSSSVYGDAETLPTPESCMPVPVSPYGATKLLGEHLCRIYCVSYGVPVVALRYFTVYGPRQRPDMGFARFIARAIRKEPITVYGDGSQSRDFTYVADAVSATRRAAELGRPGSVYNVGGGARASVNDVLDRLDAIFGRPLGRKPEPAQVGDAWHTGADTTRARQELGFRPLTALEAGLMRQVDWALAVERGDGRGAAPSDELPRAGGGDRGERLRDDPNRVRTAYETLASEGG